MKGAPHPISSDCETPSKSTPLDRPKPFECPPVFSEWSDQPEFLNKLINTFIVETQRDMESLRAALASRNSAAAASIAHRIKGGAATVGAEPMRGEAARLEALGRTGRLPEALECMTSLHSEFERFCSYVSHLTLPPVA